MIKWSGSVPALVLLISLAHAQTTTQSAAVKDATAVSLIQRSLTAMGCSQALTLQDSLATGTALVYMPDGTSQQLPIIKKSIGISLARTELQAEDGTHIRILNTGAAAIIRPNGSARRLVTNNTVAERVQHIPCLSYLAEFQGSNIEIDYAGTDIVNGSTADIVALSYTFGADANTISYMQSITRTSFYIDRQSGTVSKIEYQSCAENNTNLVSTEQIVFSDYRLVSGVLVPFTQSSYSNGVLQAVVTFTSVTFNAGISLGDFTLPAGN